MWLIKAYLGWERKRTGAGARKFERLVQPERVACIVLLSHYQNSRQLYDSRRPGGERYQY